VVRQSKRDARLTTIIVFQVYIGEHDKWVRSYGLKGHFMASLRVRRFSFFYEPKLPVPRVHQPFFGLNKWPMVIFDRL
jgi:hypothetical protein